MPKMYGGLGASESAIECVCSASNMEQWIYFGVDVIVSNLSIHRKILSLGLILSTWHRLNGSKRIEHTVFIPFIIHIVALILNISNDFHIEWV